jgi:hypothetical protein
MQPGFAGRPFTADDVLTSPRFKIARAKKHIAELENEIQLFLERKPYRVVVEEDDLEAGQHCWRIRVKEPVPLLFNPIVGDALHNLRAALDILLCNLVTLNKRSPKGVYFPIADDADSLAIAIQKGNVQRAGPDVVQIITTLQPYTGGKCEALRSLHKLDILDKHRDLIFAAHLVGLPDLRIIGGGSAHFLRNIRVGPVQDGIRVISMPPMGNVKLGDEIESAFHIQIAPGQPLAFHPVIQTLHTLTGVVETAVQPFAEYLGV